MADLDRRATKFLIPTTFRESQFPEIRYQQYLSVCSLRSFSEFRALQQGQKMNAGTVIGSVDSPGLYQWKQEQDDYACFPMLFITTSDQVR